ncbi:hypothetical protein AMTRI_Chr07g78640 [Amborella trichopoda]
MHCLNFVPRSYGWSLQVLNGNGRIFSGTDMVALRTRVSRVGASVKGQGYSENTAQTTVSIESMEKSEKSEIYSSNMTQAMGAVLTYRHELGMNYNFILPDIIVGSCLQTPGDVDKLREIGVKTIFCLQQDSDLEYFGLDIKAIQEYAKQYDDIHHYRAEIRDFDAFDLRMRLPEVVNKLYKAMNSNGGVTYVHCTAGLGRAPAVTLAYMFWVQGYKLGEANRLLQLTGRAKKLVTLKWEGANYSSVEISGLDIGWGQKIPLTLDEEQGSWILHRELPEGHYEYKYIIDGKWTCNPDDLVTKPNRDGHVNNYIDVCDDGLDDATRELRKRLMDDNVDLTKEERLLIREFLEAYNDDA